MDLNSCSLTGRLTKDPEIRQVAQRGKKYCFFTLACNFNSEKTHFIPCVSFDKIATNMAHFCKQGSRIAVNGVLQSIQNRDKRTTVQVNVTTLIILNEKEAQEIAEDNRNTEEQLKKEEKEFKQYKKDFDNPMAEVPDIDDNDLPF